MARCLRSFIPGVSVHAMQRGNNRMDVFHQPADYSTFLSLVMRVAACHAVAFHAYALMKNHVHLIVTPREPDAVPPAMKELAQGYSRYYNRTYDRIGTLWNDRYRAKLIGDERYWLTCLRYVEQNPVRAGIVTMPEVYPWSSYPAHAFGRWPDWLEPHPLYLALGRTDDERQAAYRNLCGQPLADDQLAVVRVAVGQNSTRLRHSV